MRCSILIWNKRLQGYGPLGLSYLNVARMLLAILSPTVYHLLVVDVMCVLFWDHAPWLGWKQNTRYFYHKWMINGVVIPSSLTPYLDPIPQNLFTKVFGASVDFNATYFFTIVFWLWALRNHRYILSSVQPGDSYNPWCHPNNRGEIKVAEKETECTSTS